MYQIINVSSSFYPQEPGCEESFNVKQNLILHAAIHSTESRPKCPECEKSVKHLVPHLKNKHKLRTANFKDGVKGLEKTESDPTHPTTPEPVKMDADFKDGAKELEKIESHPGHPPNHTPSLFMSSR